jgi:cytochrome c-type protein NapC
MIPYGQSLYVDDPKHIPAQHFQNHRVPPDKACYSCHTDYTIYGPLKDKVQGLKRIYMQYVSTPPNPITIPGGFKNAQCLHCHLGARSFQENQVHAALMDSMTSNQMSCLTAGCHDTVHDVANLSRQNFWKPAQ